MISMKELTKITQLGNPVDLQTSVLGRGDDGLLRPVALLLEDEPLIAMDVEMTLVDAGFEVHCAISCKNADDWLDRHRPDIVIVDIVLRDGHCTEVVSRLVQAGIPFIVHSGDYPSAHTGTAFELGAWVAKPSVATALLQAVSAVATGPSGLVNGVIDGVPLRS